MPQQHHSVAAARSTLPSEVEWCDLDTDTLAGSAGEPQGQRCLSTAVSLKKKKYYHLTEAQTYPFVGMSRRRKNTSRVDVASFQEKKRVGREIFFFWSACFMLTDKVTLVIV